MKYQEKILRGKKKKSWYRATPHAEGPVIDQSDSPGTWVPSVPTHLHMTLACSSSRVALVASIAAALRHRSCLMHLHE